jgi:hypothetical protein
MSLVAERIRHEHTELLAALLPAGRLRSYLITSPDTFVMGGWLVNAAVVDEPWYFDSKAYEVRFLLSFDDAVPPQEILDALKEAATGNDANLISITPRAAA